MLAGAIVALKHGLKHCSVLNMLYVSGKCSRLPRAAFARAAEVRSGSFNPQVATDTARFGDG